MNRVSLQEHNAHLSAALANYALVVGETPTSRPTSRQGESCHVTSYCCREEEEIKTVTLISVPGGTFVYVNGSFFYRARPKDEFWALVRGRCLPLRQPLKAVKDYCETISYVAHVEGYETDAD
jgi:hypothetical protein